MFLMLSSCYPILTLVLSFILSADNRIEDRGARAIAKVLGSDDCSIEEITFCDNRIREGGAQALGTTP